MNNGSRQQFLGGAMTLTISTVLVKVIGLIYKIPLMRCLGSVGMGYFNSAYELYTLFFVIATAGIPMAISIMISENIALGRLKNAERIYKASFWTLVCIGLIGSLVMCFGAEILADMIGNSGVVPSLILVSPTLLFISISGAVRGYFQGCRNMIPTAISQIVEASGKLILGILFALLAQKKHLPTEQVSAFAILGLSIGTLISTVYLCVAKSKYKMTCEFKSVENNCVSYSDIVRNLVILAVPVTVSSVLVSLTRIVDMFMLMNRLDENANKISVFGSYSTMALPIYNLPSSLVASIALALVPSVINAIGTGQKEREKQLFLSAVKLCAVISLPAAFGIGVYSKQILGLLFQGEYEAIEISAPLLSVLGASVFVSCFVQVTSSVLQAHGKIFMPIISMFFGLLLKCTSSYILMPISTIGAMVAPISTLLCNLVAVTLNFVFIGKYTELDAEQGKIIIKPFVYSVLSIAVSVISYVTALKNCGENIAFVVAMTVCVLLYLIFVFFGDVLDAEEYGMLPFGEKINLLRKKLRGSKNKA